MRSVFIKCLSHMLRPVARFCLRRSLSVQDLIETAKLVLIQVAEEELKRSGYIINVSRLSVATGLRRREVARLMEQDGDTKTRGGGVLNKVIGQWQHDPSFSTSQGQPRILAVDDENNEFQLLVSTVTQDIKAAAVLAELERIGAVKRTAKGLQLIESSYVPRRNPEEGFSMLASDAEDLTAAVEENIFLGPECPNLHATTEFDNIPAEHVPQIKRWLLEEGVKFHAKVRAYLARHDRDLSPQSEQLTKMRVVLGTFSRVEPKGKV